MLVASSFALLAGEYALLGGCGGFGGRYGAGCQTQVSYHKILNSQRHLQLKSGLPRLQRHIQLLYSEISDTYSFPNLSRCRKLLSTLMNFIVNEISKRKTLIFQ